MAGGLRSATGNADAQAIVERLVAGPIETAADIAQLASEFTLMVPAGVALAEAVDFAAALIDIEASSVATEAGAAVVVIIAGVTGADTLLAVLKIPAKSIATDAERTPAVIGSDHAEAIAADVAAVQARLAIVVRHALMLVVAGHAIFVEAGVAAIGLVAALLPWIDAAPRSLATFQTGPTDRAGRGCRRPGSAGGGRGRDGSRCRRRTGGGGRGQSSWRGSWRPGRCGPR